MAKSAVDKRDHSAAPRVEVLAASKGPSYPPGRMLISSPLEVLAVVARIPEGRVLTMGDLRSSLAKSHRADYTCPLTTGIFARIVAEAADEERALGKAPAPWWRVVRDDGSLMDKFPGGVERQASLLEADGVVLFRLRAIRIADLDGASWKAPPLGKRAGRAAQ